MEEKTDALAAEGVSRGINKAALSELFFTFLKIGAFTFGGGWAMVPLIRKELVEKHRWMEDEEFIDLLVLAQSAPGPIAVNTSVITGFKIRGVAGALVSTLGSSIPSFVVILLVASLFVSARGAGVIEAVFGGMRPAIFGLLAAAVLQVGRASIRARKDLAFLVAGMFLLLYFQLSPILVVLIAGLVGVVSDWVLERISDNRTRPDQDENRKSMGGGAE